MQLASGFWLPAASCQLPRTQVKGPRTKKQIKQASKQPRQVSEQTSRPQASKQVSRARPGFHLAACWLAAARHTAGQGQAREQASEEQGHGKPRYAAEDKRARPKWPKVQAKSYAQAASPSPAFLFASGSEFLVQKKQWGMGGRPYFRICILKLYIKYVVCALSS